MTVRRDPRVDGLRGLAALVVLLVCIPLVQTGRTELPVLQPALSLCFVISGYLLWRPFALSVIREDRRVDIAAYLRNRVVRLLAPITLVYGASLALGVAFAEDAWHFVALPAFCLVLPVLGAIARRQARPEDEVRAVATPGVLLTILGLVGTVAHDVIGYATAFGVGMLAVAATTAVTARRTLRRNVWSVRRAAVLFALAGLAALPASIQLGVSTPAMALAVGAVLVLVNIPGRELRRWVADIIGSLPFRYPGRISYGLILWHFPVALAVQEHVEGSGTLRAASAILATWLAAEITHRLVEVPLQKLRAPSLRKVHVPFVQLPAEQLPEQLADPVVFEAPPGLGKHRATGPADA